MIGFAPGDRVRIKHLGETGTVVEQVEEQYTPRGPVYVVIPDGWGNVSIPVHHTNLEKL